MKGFRNSNRAWVDYDGYQVHVDLIPHLCYSHITVSCFIDNIDEDNAVGGHVRRPGTHDNIHTGHCGSGRCPADVQLLQSNRSHGQTLPNMSDFTLQSHIARKGLYSVERSIQSCAVRQWVAFDGETPGFACKPVSLSPMPIPMTSRMPVSMILQPSCRSRTQACADDWMCT